MEAFHNAINPFKRLRIRLLTCLDTLFKTGPLAQNAQIIQVNNYQHDDYRQMFEQLSSCDKKVRQISGLRCWYERIKMLARSTVWLARTFPLFQPRQQINFDNRLDYIFIDYSTSKECIRNFDRLAPSYWGNLKSVIPKGKTILNLTIPTNRQVWSYASQNLVVQSNNFNFQKICPSSLLNRSDFFSIIVYFLKSLVLSVKISFILRKSNSFSRRLMNLWSRTIISPNFLQDLCIELSLKKLNITKETVVIYLCEFNSWEFVVTRYFNSKKVKKIIAFDHTFLRAQDLRWQSLDLVPESKARSYCPTLLAIGNIYSMQNIKNTKSILSSYVTQVEALRFPENRISRYRKFSAREEKIFIFLEISFSKSEVLISPIENWIKTQYPNSEVVVKCHPAFLKTENHLGLFENIDATFEFDSNIGDLISEMDVAICLGSTSVLAILAETNILVYHSTSLSEFNFCVLPDECFDEWQIESLMLLRRLANYPNRQIFCRNAECIRWRELIDND